MAGSPGTEPPVVPREASPSDQPEKSATELLLRFTRVGHQAGYPTAELEERVHALARQLGLADVQISATPTIVEVSLGALSHQRSYTLRVRPRAVDLDAIARLTSSPSQLSSRSCRA